MFFILFCVVFIPISQVSMNALSCVDVVFGVSPLTRTRLDITILVFNRWATACNRSTLPLWSSAGSTAGPVTFGTTLWAAWPSLPWRPAGTRYSNHWCLQELLNKGYKEKKGSKKKEKGSRLKSLRYTRSCQIGSLKKNLNERASMEIFWIQVTQCIWLCQQAYFSVCPSLKLYLCLSCILQFLAVGVSSVWQSRCGPPPRRLTGGDR